MTALYPPASVPEIRKTTRSVWAPATVSSPCQAPAISSPDAVPWHTKPASNRITCPVDMSGVEDDDAAGFVPTASTMRVWYQPLVGHRIHDIVHAQADA